MREVLGLCGLVAWVLVCACAGQPLPNTPACEPGAGEAGCAGLARSDDVAPDVAYVPESAIEPLEPEVPPVVPEPESPIPIAADDPTWGEPDAPVTIVFVGDYQCPFSQRVSETIDRVREEYGPTRVRIVFRHNPLPFHREAWPAAEAAVVVHRLAGDDAFWVFSRKAFQNRQGLTTDEFGTWAEAAGVDKTRFVAAFENRSDESQPTSDGSPSPAAKVAADMLVNRKLGVTGTPSFHINGIVLPGAQPFERFKELIDEQLRQAAELAESGVPPRFVSAELTKKNFEGAPPPTLIKHQEPDLNVWKIPVEPKDPQLGPKDALVTIVEWADFQCPFCFKVQQTLTRIREKYGDDVRIVWKDNPLPFHKQAAAAATLARIAFDQGGNAKFWEARALLFDNQKNLSEQTLQQISESLRIPWWKVSHALKHDKYGAFLLHSQDVAQDFNARGTPHFFINGRRLSGAQPFEKFVELIDEQLDKAQSMVASGTPRANVYAELMATAEEPTAPEKRTVESPTKDHPWRGARHPKVVVQLFSDLECPYSARVAPTLDLLLQRHKDVRIVWRNMPLPFHKNATLAAEAAHEVFVQQGNNGFWKYNKALFADQAELDREHLDSYAQAQGIDMARFGKALEERTHQVHVEADMAVAKKAGMRGTPSFLVNDYFMSGAQPIRAFERLVEYARKHP